MRLIIFHDFLIEKGGGERVVKTLLEIPNFEKIIVSSIYIPERTYSEFSKQKIISVNPLLSRIISLSFILKVPFSIFFFKFFTKKLAKFFNKDIYIFSGYYSIFAVSNLSERSKKICYLQIEPYDVLNKRESFRFLKPILSFISPILTHFQRKYLLQMNRIIANSNYIKKLFERYGIKVDKVIYPPVIFEFKSSKKIKKGKFFLYVGRLYKNKRPHIVVKTFLRNKKEKLIIVGDGPLRNIISKISSETKNIKYLGRVTDEELAKLYSLCKAVIYIPEAEHFGLVSLEANAFGKPAIVSNEGGLPETIKNELTGIIINEPYQESLEKILKNFKRFKFSSRECIKNSKRFSKEVFIRKMYREIMKLTKEK